MNLNTHLLKRTAAAGGTHHLQQRQVSQPHVVEVDLHLGPVELGVVQRVALRLVVHHRGVVHEAGAVHAFAELAGEQVDAHDAEDEPEDQAHQQHVHDGWDGADQGVHHHLRTRAGSPSQPAFSRTRLRGSTPSLMVLGSIPSVPEV